MPTWDDLKVARDGTTQPLLVRPGETAGDLAWKRDRMKELKREMASNEQDLDWAYDEQAELEEKISTLQRQGEVLREELKKLID